MILFWLIVILIVGAGLAWLSGRWSRNLPRWISLLALGIDFGLMLYVWISSGRVIELTQNIQWLIELKWNWIPQFGINFHLRKGLVFSFGSNGHLIVNIRFHLSVP